VRLQAAIADAGVGDDVADPVRVVGRVVGGVVPPPPPPPPVKILVKSSVLPPRPEQFGETPPPGHGWSRPIDQNASRPIPLACAQFTMVRAFAWLTTSPALSLLPIIGVMPMFAEVTASPAAFAALSVPAAAVWAAAAMSPTGCP
jgi:hypothetical protein